MWQIIKIAFLFLCLLVSSVQAQYVATDPSRLTPSARVLGMGRGFVGLADEAAAIYLNPAGLANLDKWDITSMSGQLLEEFIYTSMSGVYPTPWGVFGAGFDSASITGCPVTTIEAGTELDPHYIVDVTQPEVAEYNNVIFLSYGNQANKILRFLPEGLAVGGNLKIFMKGMTGDRIQDGSASGTELDVALHYKTPWKWLTLGSTVQNILPLSAGGKLQWKGHEESYPAVMENGAAFKILGNENSIWRFRDMKLSLLTDFDYYPTTSNYPLVWHTGVEWYPTPLIALRTGFDQEAAGDGSGGLTTLSNFTAGVGVNLEGFRFDYAYHAFANAPGISNHFFSLSYGFAAAKPGVGVEVLEPKDRSMTFDSNLRVEGIIHDPSVHHLKINGIPVMFDLRGRFETIMDFKEGKNKIIFSLLDDNKNTIAEQGLRILRLKSFPDVAKDYWVAKPISLLAMQGIITGYPDGKFKPEGNINRAEMCTLLMKAKGEALAPSEAEGLRITFNDLPSKHWAAPYIAQAAKLGIVKGYPDGTFRPKNKITRAEGLAMITRLAGILEKEYADEFPDVTSKHWSSKIIAGAYKAGLLEFLKDQPFRPKRSLTRAETVEMLYRTEYVQSLLGEGLLDWETY